MILRPNANLASKALLPLGAALAFTLAACSAEEEPTYETDVEDVSGGELIVTEDDPEAVDVDLPDTEMTPVPEGEEAAAEEEPAAE